MSDKLPTPQGEFVTLEGQPFYRIADYDVMSPFLMNVPSDTDLWMFIASSGGITAGRVDADGAVFPYETVDKLHDNHHHNGPVTLLRVTDENAGTTLWEPFRRRPDGGSRIKRNLYKNAIGNRVVFEEHNHDLGLAFRYRWTAADAFGVVRSATITNHGDKPVTVELLDGMRNILPHGAPLALYQQSSSLIDAYKRTDVDATSGLAMFSLTATIVDRPEAAESLRTNIAWSCGLNGHSVCLSPETVDAFARGEHPRPESVLKGRRGNYFVQAEVAVAAAAAVTWHIAVDAGLSHVDVAALRRRLRDETDMSRAIEDELRDADDGLRLIVGSADGFQLSNQQETDVHHFANVLFNNMRGGVFDYGYEIPSADFTDFVHTRHREVAARQADFLDSLPPRVTRTELLEQAAASADPNFERLVLEYLPLYFSRRHGGPSRPWNQFSIRVRGDDGARALNYEGNWRDIFQNWQALGLSFPGFVPNMVAKFVNASTIDGFNPYRITRDGFDWEVADPDDPWSYIGYWGDHQIVYLLALLEAMQGAMPDELGHWFTREVFSYANVPYRIRPYQDLVADPHETIDFDNALAARIDERVAALGTDGRLLAADEDRVYHVNLLEKLVVPVLSKVSNLVPDAGIWMNTQRPEWNDANNALAGNGASMVTVCYLRRYLRFLANAIDGLETNEIRMSTEVATWLENVNAVLEDHATALGKTALDDRARRTVVDALGKVFSDYRLLVYGNGFTGATMVGTERIATLCQLAGAYVDHTINTNRAEDGLYHAYNLLGFTTTGSLELRRLYTMLEGQVAVLSSGAIAADEAASLLDRMFESQLYSDKHGSFLLYPELELPAFTDKNVIPQALLQKVAILTDLIDAGDDSLVARDVDGVYRFHGDFKNAQDLGAALDRLAENDRWQARVERERDAVLDVFEQVFDHAAFTGRSSTMHGYEGLGCVYWHMVAKLLVAVQEIAMAAARSEHPAAQRLTAHYYRIRRGLGFEKSVAAWGAFPTDPYSHTQPHGGARQPGMTGQVKEEILTRFGELGVTIDGGVVRFEPRLLKKAEFRDESGVYHYFNVLGSEHSIDLPANSLAFSLCQVPVVFQLTDEESWIRVTAVDGAVRQKKGHSLSPEDSRDILERRGSLAMVEVGIAANLLLAS